MSLSARPLTHEMHPFLAAFHGGFSGVLRWAQLDALWEALLAPVGKRWYIYAVGEKPPGDPATTDEFQHFIQEIDQKLRKEHEEDYCGIIYADNLDDPSFIKIYDSGNLGVVCGFSEHPPLPGWILSTIPPVDLTDALTPPATRRRWWRRLVGG